MEIVILTNEYPPHIYGGAGVHVLNLTRELSILENAGHNLHVFCFGEQREQKANLKVHGVNINFDIPYQNLSHRRMIDTLFRNIFITGSVSSVDIVHCHTWYTMFAGCLIKQIFNVPLIITAHSLEPQRPWKTEQMGSMYRASMWIERTAFENADGIIAVSRFMKNSIRNLYKIPNNKIRTIPNGIDTNQYKPTFNKDLLRSYNIDPDQPYILFVGRITRQKGIFHFLNSIKYILRDVQIVLVAADPDTIDVRNDLKKQIQKTESEKKYKIFWIDKFIPEEHLIVLYSHAKVFICPSIYEPFGIINLEAMACGTPVVASAVGGIPEIVVHKETGFLVPFESVNKDNPEPKDPEKFAQDIAKAINEILISPEKRELMSLKARERVIRHYSWKSVADKTLKFYKDLTQKMRTRS